MTSCKLRKGLARLGDLAQGPHANRHVCAMLKYHEPLGSRLAWPPCARWHNCATPARAARSPRAQGHAHTVAPGRRDLNANRCSFRGFFIFLYREHFYRRFSRVSLGEFIHAFGLDLSRLKIVLPFNDN